jgi:MFS family permease
MIALYCVDRFGRLTLWRAAIVFWAIGDLMQVFSSGIYGFLLFARIWTGMGAGALTVVSPIYLTEIASSKLRGMIISAYMTALLLWFTIGNIASVSNPYGCSHLCRIFYQLCCHDTCLELFGFTVPHRPSHTSYAYSAGFDWFYLSG